MKNLRSLKCGGVAQLGEHLLCKQGVRSSILLISTTAEARCKRQEARKVIAESVKHCKKRDKVRIRTKTPKRIAQGDREWRCFAVSLEKLRPLTSKQNSIFKIA